MAQTPHRSTLHASYLGRIGYSDALELQLECRAAVLAGAAAESLLLLEHPPVYTLGRNANPVDVTADRGWLRARGIEVVATDRGGQVTYHGPGQLVGYPVIDLGADRRDIRRYVRDLQEVLVRTLAEFGVSGSPGVDRPHIGVWVGAAKIASIGIHLKRWVTTHGFAVNVATDLEMFGGIVACGLPDVRMTSIERLTGERPRLERVAQSAAAHFAAVFERDLEWQSEVAPTSPRSVGGAAR